MQATLRLHLDRIAAKSAPVSLPPVRARALYVVEGAVAVRGADGVATQLTLGANAGMALSDGGVLAGASLDGVVLRWELTAGASPAAADRPLLEAAITLDDGRGWLLRCDRVDFPPAGEALLHTHQGAGIRCVLAGTIRIESMGATHLYRPLEPWFENGVDPVYAAADATTPSAFARVMILPDTLLGGKSSIAYVRAEDLAKPKSQRYQIFIDAPIRPGAKG
jgi:hypothetical protein